MKDLIDLFPPLEFITLVEKSLPFMFNWICRERSISLHSSSKQSGFVCHNRVYQSWANALYFPILCLCYAYALSTCRKRLCRATAWPKVKKSCKRSCRTLRLTSAAPPNVGCRLGACITALNISSSKPFSGKSYNNASGELLSIATNIGTNLSPNCLPSIICRLHIICSSLYNGTSCHLVLREDYSCANIRWTSRGYATRVLNLFQVAS